MVGACPVPEGSIDGVLVTGGVAGNPTVSVADVPESGWKKPLALSAANKSFGADWVDECDADVGCGWGNNA